MNSQLSAKCSLWANRILALTVVALCVFLPRLLLWYQTVRPLGPEAADGILYGYYLCVPVVGFALWSIDRLLRNILAGRVFEMANVRFLRRIRWCCAGVSVICIPAAWLYPPLIFLVAIMAFLALMVSVVKNVMAAAVEIREENELTV